MDSLQVPPHDIDAERSVLAAMLLQNECILDVMELLAPGDFYAPSHGQIFEAACELYEQGQPVDFVTLPAALKRKGTLESCGGSEYLVLIVHGLAGAGRATHHARIVREAATLRGIRDCSIRALGEVAPGADPAAIIEWMGREVLELAEPCRGKGPERIGGTMHEVVAEIIAEAGTETRLGVSTGFRALDLQLCGFQPGQLIVLAARPGVGKSALAGEFLIAAALGGHRAALFSLEMRRKELIKRWISQRYGYAAETIRQRKSLGERGEAGVMKVLHELQHVPLEIDDDASVTVTAIRARCRRMHRKQPLGLVVVDYLQLLNGEERGQARHEAVGAISRGLKLLAMELDVPVIALSQLNRASESRADKRPTMAELRESGSIEQDADVVMLLHKPSLSDANADPRLVELNIAKQRSGPTGTVKLSWDEHRGKFEPWVEDGGTGKLGGAA